MLQLLADGSKQQGLLQNHMGQLDRVTLFYCPCIVCLSLLVYVQQVAFIGVDPGKGGSCKFQNRCLLEIITAHVCKKVVRPLLIIGVERDYLRGAIVWSHL